MKWVWVSKSFWDLLICLESIVSYRIGSQQMSVKIINTVVLFIYLFLSSPEDFFFPSFLERKKEWEEGGERNIYVREKYLLVASVHVSTRGHRCPDWELDSQPRYAFRQGIERLSVTTF